MANLTQMLESIANAVSANDTHHTCIWHMLYGLLCDTHTHTPPAKLMTQLKHIANVCVHLRILVSGGFLSYKGLQLFMLLQHGFIQPQCFLLLCSHLHSAPCSSRCTHTHSQVNRALHKTWVSPGQPAITGWQADPQAMMGMLLSACFVLACMTMHWQGKKMVWCCTMAWMHAIGFRHPSRWHSNLCRHKLNSDKASLASPDRGTLSMLMSTRLAFTTQ